MTSQGYTGLHIFKMKTKNKSHSQHIGTPRVTERKKNRLCKAGKMGNVCARSTFPGKDNFAL